MVRQRAQLLGPLYRGSGCGTVTRLHPDRVRAAGAPRHHAHPQAESQPPHAHLPGLLPAQVSKRARSRDGYVGRQDGQEGTRAGGGGGETTDGGSPERGEEGSWRCGVTGGDRGGGRGGKEDHKCPHTSNMDSTKRWRHYCVPLCSYSRNGPLQSLDLDNMLLHTHTHTHMELLHPVLLPYLSQLQTATLIFMSFSSCSSNICLFTLPFFISAFKTVRKIKVGWLFNCEFC